MEKEMRAWLLQDGQVAAAVGDRIFPLLIPLNSELPAIYFLREPNDDSEESLSGKGIYRAQYQFACVFAEGDAFAAIELAAAVRRKLANFSGLTSSGDRVMRVRFVDEWDGVMDPTKQPIWFERSLAFEFTYTPAEEA